MMQEDQIERVPRRLRRTKKGSVIGREFCQHGRVKIRRGLNVLRLYQSERKGGNEKGWQKIYFHQTKSGLIIGS